MKLTWWYENWGITEIFFNSIEGSSRDRGVSHLIFPIGIVFVRPPVFKTFRALWFRSGALQERSGAEEFEGFEINGDVNGNDRWAAPTAIFWWSNCKSKISILSAKWRDLESS